MLHSNRKDPANRPETPRSRVRNDIKPVGILLVAHSAAQILPLILTYFNNKIHQPIPGLDLP